MGSSDIIENHRGAGDFFNADGVRSFVRDEGKGEAVLCVHGVPASSFLYRKVLTELSVRGYRALCFDLPGLGLAERPEEYDYTWTGLGQFARKAVRELELERFHLVVHDIGGPVGFEVAAAMSDRIDSITLLNTIIRVDNFSRPWVMEPFAHWGIGEIWLKSMFKPVFRQLMYRIGLSDSSAVTSAEINAYVDLLKRNDRGAALLKIMRGFERTEEKAHKYVNTVRNTDYPVGIVWGENDPALSLSRYGVEAQEIVGREKIRTVPGKHFLQEDNAPEIANYVDELARSASRTEP
ncbi:MAG: alpha/beta fold hydrolase [bacterium]